MSNKNDTAKQSADKTQLDAPLALSADQLEHVAGGMGLTRIGPIGPTNGLYQAVKLDSLAQFSVPSQVAF